MTNKRPPGRSFAFVSFSSGKEANDALEGADGKFIDDHKIFVEVSRTPWRGAPSSQRGDIAESEDDDDGASLFLNNLHASVRNSDIRALAKRFGPAY